MNKLRTLVATYGVVLVLLIIAGIGVVMGLYQGEVAIARSGVFFTIAAVLLAEYFAIIARTPEGTWDALGVSMAFFRLAVINYMASIAVYYVQGDTFPEWWWTSSRVFMGISAAIGLFFIAREDFEAWGELNWKRRVKFLSALGAYVVILFVIVMTLGVEPMRRP
jgi:hypothetical protein